MICKKENISVETLSGIKYLTLTVEGGSVKYVSVDMGKASFKAEDIPTTYGGEMIDAPAAVDGKTWRMTAVSVGNPHWITVVDDPYALELEKIGPAFENHPLFPERVNTEFIRVIDRHTLDMRVWERGSGETMACGTGACAAVTASVLNGFCPEGEDVTVRLRGGELVIQYTPQRVLMTGNAQIAFTGVVELPEETET